MEPITTALAGFALFKSAVDGIKGAIGTARDVSEIAGHIDALFDGEKQVQQERNRKSGMGVGDQLGVKSVATEIINARLAQEQMQEIATMVDFRFGHGTWKSITEERARRIQAAKEAAMQAKREKLRQQRELEETIKNVVLTLTVVVVAFGFFVFLFMVVL
jgi:phage anti-repressor protein